MPSSLQCAVRLFREDQRRGTSECDVGGAGCRVGGGVCMAGSVSEHRGTADFLVTQAEVFVGLGVETGTDLFMKDLNCHGE